MSKNDFYGTWTPIHDLRNVVSLFIFSWRFNELYSADSGSETIFKALYPRYIVWGVAYERHCHTFYPISWAMAQSFGVCERFLGHVNPNIRFKRCHKKFSIFMFSRAIVHWFGSQNDIQGNWPLVHGSWGVIETRRLLPVFREQFVGHVNHNTQLERCRRKFTIFSFSRRFHELWSINLVFWNGIQGT